MNNEPIPSNVLDSFKKTLKHDPRKRWGRLLSPLGKPFRASNGHVYFRQDRRSPIRRLSHKHTGPAAFEKLTKRQQIRTVRREMFANSVA